jgi:putative DNA primase/helicase
MGMAIATGGEILRFKAPEPRKVLYVDGEMPASSMQERLSKLVTQNPNPSFFKIITPDLQENGIRDIATKEGQEDIDEHLEGIDFLILDNLSTLIQSKSENDAGDWIPVQQWLLSLRKRGISVLLIHHAGKGGQQRGSSKKEDILDTVIALKRPKNWSATDGVRFELHFEKNRGFEGEKALPFEASLSFDEQGRQTWVCKDLEERCLETVYDLLKEGLSQREIAKEMEVSLGKANRLVQQAKRQMQPVQRWTP